MQPRVFIEDGQSLGLAEIPGKGMLDEQSSPLMYKTDAQGLSSGQAKG
jgi:hypothetical protein